MNQNNVENNKNNKSPTQKITYAGVLSALATVFIILTIFLPLRFSLLMAAAACFFLAFEKCGVLYGFLTIVSSIAISFFVQPFSSAFFLTVIAFAPYSIAAFFLKKFSYFVVKEAIIRIVVMTVFSVLVFIFIWLAAESIGFDILYYIQKLSYIGFGLLFVVFIIVFDFSFSIFIKRAIKLIR